MKTIVLIFAIAACALANPVVNEVTKEDIEQLLDDFATINNEGDKPITGPGNNTLVMKSDGNDFNITFFGTVFFWKGNWNFTAKEIKLTEDLLEINTTMKWSKTRLEAKIRVVGTIDGKLVNDTTNLTVIAGNIHNNIWFKFSLDDKSVTLEDFEIQEILHGGFEVVTTPLERVNHKVLDEVIKTNFEGYVKKITPQHRNQVKIFLLRYERDLKKKNLREHVHVIRETLSKRLAQMKL